MLLSHVCDTGGIPVDKITFPMLDRACITGFLEQTRAERNWTAATYNQRLACIRSFFKYAATAEPTLAIHLADLAGIPLMKAPATKPVSHMSQQAIKALLAQPDPTIRTGLRDQFFMILMYDTAARDAEMLSAAIGDLDATRLTIDLLGKGSKPRRIPITKETAATTGATPPRSTPTPSLATRCSTPSTATARGACPTTTPPGSFASTPKPPTENAPKCPPERTPHMLRHSRAMHLYQAGMPLALLTEWLGHADPETTLIYAHADTEMKTVPSRRPPPTAPRHPSHPRLSGTTTKTSSTGYSDSDDRNIPTPNQPKPTSPQAASTKQPLDTGPRNNPGIRIIDVEVVTVDVEVVLAADEREAVTELEQEPFQPGHQRGLELSLRDPIGRDCQNIGGSSSGA